LAVVEKARELATKNESRAPLVYRVETGFDPGSYGVLVYAKQSRDLLHGIAAVKLDAPRVDPLHNVNASETRFLAMPTLNPLIALSPTSRVKPKRMPLTPARVSCANLGRWVSRTRDAMRRPAPTSKSAEPAPGGL
jgi:hypothetical protein